MSQTLTVRHRGKRGIRILSLEGGGYLSLSPGDEKIGTFDDEYADVLRMRGATGHAVMVVEREKDAEERTYEKEQKAKAEPQKTESPATEPKPEVVSSSAPLPTAETGGRRRRQLTEE